MANFTAGTSFTDGVTNDVTAAKLNALVADAVPTANLSLNSTTGTIANFTASTANVTTGTITTLTNGTTTATAEVITSGTIQSLTSSTANITSGTFGGSINSTTGTIGNLSTTLAGDFTISQGTATLGTTGATAATYGTTSDIPRITVDAKGRITSATTVTAPVGFRNRIINGDMRIDQRNAGASVTLPDGLSNYAFPVDRWCAARATNGTATAQQSTVAPNNYTNSIVYTTGGSITPNSGTAAYLIQFVEGYNIADLGFGTSSAKAITISFWVRSSVDGTYGASLTNSASNRSYPFTYSISSANTWEQKSITISGDTSGTWLTDNGRGIALIFDMGSSSTFRGTAGSWSGSQLYGVTGTVQLNTNSNATFYITGVQLEAGSTATDFERRPYGTELALCQRYYYQSNSSLTSGITVGGSAFFNAFNATEAFGSNKFAVPMRTTPSLSFYDNVGVKDSVHRCGIGNTGATVSPYYINNNGWDYITKSSAWAAGNVIAATFSVSAEL